MRDFNKKRDLIILIFIALSISLVHKLLKRIFLGYNIDTWNFSEFLINYRGGFIRRGLIGEIILLTQENFDISINFQIFLISLTMLISYCIVYFIIFKKLKIPFYIISSILFLQNAIINDFVVRKDILIIMVFVAMSFFLHRKTIISYIAYFFLFVVGISIHESIFFISIPILFLLSIKKLYSSKVFDFKNISFFVTTLLSILYFLLVMVRFNGNKYNSDMIWRSLQNISPDLLNNPQSAIQALSWSPKVGLSLFFNTLTNFNDGIYAPIAWGLIVFVIFILLTNITIFSPKNLIDKNKIILYALLQFIGIFPLWIFGWDYSRWCFYWSSSFMILLYFDPLKNHNLKESFVSKIIKLFDFKTSKTTYIILLLILGIPMYSWDMLLFTNSSTLYIILNELTIFIQELK